MFLAILSSAHVHRSVRSGGKRLIASFNKEFNISGSLLTEKQHRVGLSCQVTHIFSQEDVNTFAQLCGDNNPLHSDPDFAKTTMFKGTIVHGIFVSSLFSTLFGRTVSGSVYVSQNLSFKRPVHVGVPVTAQMEILSMEDRKKGILMTCSTKCTLEDGVVAVDGEAKVLLPKPATL